jgi:hypothetical protein
MALEFRVVGIFQRNNQNLSTDPNVFHFKDYVKFNGKVKYAYAALMSIDINTDQGIKDYAIQVLAGPHPLDPNAAEGILTIRGTPIGENTKFFGNAQYIIIADTE